MDFEFRETIFKNSNLDLILVEDVKVWKSKGWVEVNDFSILEKDSDEQGQKFNQNSDQLVRRKVTEQFETKAVQKLVKTSLKSPKFEAEYRGFNAENGREI